MIKNSKTLHQNFTREAIEKSILSPSSSANNLCEKDFCDNFTQELIIYLTLNILMSFKPENLLKLLMRKVPKKD